MQIHSTSGFASEYGGIFMGPCLNQQEKANDAAEQ